jgi:hypothetical protein
VVAKANLWNRVPRRLLFVNADCGVGQSNYLLFNIRTPTLALVREDVEEKDVFSSSRLSLLLCENLYWRGNATILIITCWFRTQDPGMGLESTP